MAIELSPEQARRLHLRAQGLTPMGASWQGAPAAVARQVCGLQAQDIFAAALGVRVRSAGATLGDVEAARTGERSVVWTWAMRGTMHLVATEDLDWLLPLLGPAFVAAAARRRQELGLDDQSYRRGLEVVCAHLEAHGAATRMELAGALAGAGLQTGYSIERHLLHRAALEGILCMGRDRGSEPTYVLLEDWLGRPLSPLPHEAALARLAARYLAAYAPAAPEDLAAWSGLALRTVRAGWKAIAGELAEVSVAGRRAWLPRARLDWLGEPPGRTPSVRLLPAFDTYLLGYRTRALVVDPAYAPRINAGGGMIRAVVLVDGRVEGTWQANRKGRRVHISVEPFDGFSPAVVAGVEAEKADIERFLAGPEGATRSASGEL